MKKLIAMLLVLSLAVLGTAAIAEGKSPTPDTPTHTSTSTAAAQTEVPIIIIVDDTARALEDLEAIVASVNGGEKVVNLLDDEAKAQVLAAGLTEDAELVEHVSIALNPASTVDIATVAQVELTVTFDTLFEEGAAVVGVLKIFSGDTVKYFVIPGKANEDGSVTFVVSNAMLTAMDGAEACVLMALR